MLAADKSANVSKTINILLIGCGPHAKRVYLPALNKLNEHYDINVNVVVELETQEEATIAATSPFFSNVEFLFTPPFKSVSVIPLRFRNQLDQAVKRHNINGIIIATA